MVRMVGATPSLGISTTLMPVTSSLWCPTCSVPKFARSLSSIPLHASPTVSAVPAVPAAPAASAGLAELLANSEAPGIDDNIPALSGGADEDAAAVGAASAACAVVNIRAGESQ